MQAKTPLQEDIHFRVLKLLQDNPHLTQRDLAAELGVSVGKVNYLLNAKGIKNRLALTRSYLERKTREYTALKSEIASLQAEVKQSDAANPLGGPK